MTYEEQLNDPRWKDKRDYIIEKYWGYCSKFGTSKNLQVHHKRYINGLMAWEYPDHLLIALCRDCHELEHGLVRTDGPRSIRDAMIDFIKGLMKGGK